jgi:hypothetical protein
VTPAEVADVRARWAEHGNLLASAELADKFVEVPARIDGPAVATLVRRAPVDVAVLLTEVERLAKVVRGAFVSLGPLNKWGEVGPIDEINLRQMRERLADALGPEACAKVAEEEDWGSP